MLWQRNQPASKNSLGCRLRQGARTAAAYIQLPVWCVEAFGAMVGDRHAKDPAADCQVALSHRPPCAPAGRPVNWIPAQACQRKGAKGRCTHHICRYDPLPLAWPYMLRSNASHRWHASTPTKSICASVLVALQHRWLSYAPDLQHFPAETCMAQASFD